MYLYHLHMHYVPNRNLHATPSNFNQKLILGSILYSVLLCFKSITLDLAFAIILVHAKFQYPLINITVSQK